LEGRRPLAAHRRCGLTRGVGRRLRCADRGLRPRGGSPGVDSEVAASFRGPTRRRATRVVLDPSHGPMHVMFMATWCQPCLAEIPKLVDLEDRWKAEGYRLFLLRGHHPPDPCEAARISGARAAAGPALVRRRRGCRGGASAPRTFRRIC
jgi:hypothetical protein